MALHYLSQHTELDARTERVSWRNEQTDRFHEPQRWPEIRLLNPVIFKVTVTYVWHFLASSAGLLSDVKEM